MDILNSLVNQFFDSTKELTEKSVHVDTTIKASAAASKSRNDLNEQWLDPVLPTIRYKPVKIDNRARINYGTNNGSSAPHSQSGSVFIGASLRYSTNCVLSNWNSKLFITF